MLVIDPATEEVIGTVADPADAIRALDTADSHSWARSSPYERSEVLRRTYELMIADRERLARLITAENGKSVDEARGEVDYSAEFFRWYSARPRLR